MGMVLDTVTLLTVKSLDTQAKAGVLFKFISSCKELGIVSVFHASVTRNYQPA